MKNLRFPLKIFWTITICICFVSVHGQTDSQDIYNATIEQYVKQIIANTEKEINIEVYYFLNIDNLIDTIDNKRINYIKNQDDLRKLLSAKNESHPVSTLSCVSIDNGGVLSVSILHYNVIRVSNKKNYKYNYSRYGTTTIFFRFDCISNKYNYFEIKHEEI
jgi:hypothetical protein